MRRALDDIAGQDLQVTMRPLSTFPQELP